MQTLSTLLGVVMVLVCLTLGTLVLTTDTLSDSLYGGKRTGFVVLMYLYALYRGYRLYLFFRQKREE